MTSGVPIYLTTEQETELARATMEEIRTILALKWDMKSNNLRNRRTEVRKKLSMAGALGSNGTNSKPRAEPKPLPLRARTDFARPAWFEENIDTMARGRRHG